MKREFPENWPRLPGPAEFIETIVEDLVDGNTVAAGIPAEAIQGVRLEVAEAVEAHGIGRWTAARHPPEQDVSPRKFVYERVRSISGDLVLWVEATREDVAEHWTEYITNRDNEEDAPRICVAMEVGRARSVRENSGLRTRLWSQFVSSLDSRVVIERLGRRLGWHATSIALKSALVAELAGSDLADAAQLAQQSLERILSGNQHRSRQVWKAQVAVLFPIVEQERRRLLEKHRMGWCLPFTRKDGRTIRRVEELEIGDMVAQARANVSFIEEWRGLEWLRSVRNHLAHFETVPWATLASPRAPDIVDFKE